MRARRDDPDLGRRDDVAVVVEGHDRLDDDPSLAGRGGVAERAAPDVARREAPRRRRGHARLARAGDGRLEPRPHEREADDALSWPLQYITRRTGFIASITASRRTGTVIASNITSTVRAVPQNHLINHLINTKSLLMLLYLNL